MLAEGGCPRHFELVAEEEATSSGYGLVSDISTREHAIVGKMIGDRAEESKRLGGRSKITHVPGKNGEERIHLVRPEPYHNALLLRAPYLAT